MLLRQLPDDRESLLAPFPETTSERLAAIAYEQSPLNSKLLLRFLQAAEQVPRSPLAHLPLELAIIDVTESNT
jgi:hypothetical protein